jgi:hypothetical protein
MQLTLKLMINAITERGLTQEKPRRKFSHFAVTWTDDVCLFERDARPVQMDGGGCMLAAARRTNAMLKTWLVVVTMMSLALAQPAPEWPAPAAPGK